MKILRVLYKILLCFSCLISAFFICIYVYSYFNPKIDIRNTSNIIMLDKDDNIFYQNIGANSWVSLDNMSKYIKEAIISVEDKNFFAHKGFDYPRIMKALYVDIKNGSLDQGASTISQQYVKNLYLSFDKTWKRKIDEAFLTFDLEMHYSKEAILEGYLNTINFGGGTKGIEEASLYYFNKHAYDLSLAEASIIVGIPKNPTYYNPIIYYNNAKERQKVVLDSMVNNHYISSEEARDAFSEELIFYGKKDSNMVISSLYYRDAVNDELNHIKLSLDKINKSGLIIYTNLDSYSQSKIETIIDEEMGEGQEEIGLMIREPKTGAIRVLIGGKNYSRSEYNRVTQSKRQVGSVIKPFLYLAALKNGMTSTSLFSSEKTDFSLGDNKIYSPRNYGDNYPNKEITMALAIALSDNIYAVKTHLFLGYNELIKTLKRLGVKNQITPVASLALGTEELNMLDFSNAYSVLANKGILNEPFFIRKITDLDGNILYEKEYSEDTVEDYRYIYILNDMLANTYNYTYIDYASPTLLVVKNLLTRKYYAKSGTTDFDYWVVGYNSDALAMVWSGYDDNRKVGDLSSLVTKRIWARSIETYLEGTKDEIDEIPLGVLGTFVNPINGSTSDLTKKDLLFFIKGTEPYFIQQKKKD